MRNLALAGLLGASLLFLPVTVRAQTRLPGSRLSGPIDASRMVALSGHVHPRARAEFDQGPVDPSLQISNVILGLKLTPAQQADLQQFLTAQQDPASPDYHRWLTPDQFAARFGAAQADIDQTTAWLRSQGLSVDTVSSVRNWIAFSGSAQSIGAALHTEFHRFVSGGETHFANAVEPSVPEALAPVVSGLLGLHDYRPKRVHSMHLQDPLLTSYDGSHVPGPADLALIYDFQQLYNLGVDGTGQSIAIAGQSNVHSTDIALYRKHFNLSPANFTTKVFGPSPAPDPISEQEADLDIEWAGGIARNANIILVYSNDAFQSLIYSIDQNVAPVVSLSFGDCERYWVSDALLYQNIMQQGNAQGQTVVIAGGDAGAAECDIQFTNPLAANGLAADFPSSIPETTAVGGSQFSDTRGNYWNSTPDANGAFVVSYIPEAVWNETALDGTIAAGGGGASAVFPKPAWQTGPGVPNDQARDLPDIALNASADHDGYLLCNGGNCGVSGGTSAATPVFAGMVALINHYLTKKGVISQPGLGNVNPVLYRMSRNNPNAFHDITQGNNILPCGAETPNCVNGQLGYSAGLGYDLASGLGSLDVYNLATQWDLRAQSEPALTLTVTPSSATLNDTLQLQATLQVSGAPPTGQVTFSYQGGSFPGSSLLTGAALLGSTTLTGTLAPISVPASELALGPGTVVASYSGDSVYNNANASAPVNVSLPSSGSAVVPSMDPPAVPETIDASGPSWDYTLTLHELAGKATTLTSFVIDGNDYSSQIADFFGQASIRARGTLNADLSATGVQPPVTRVFVFGGVDADGTRWTRTLSVPFLGLQQLLNVGGVSNAASGDTAFAPGMLVSVYGQNMANATASAPSLPLPVKLGGASATVNGVAAPMWYSSSGQLNVQVPYETQVGNAVLTVNNGLETASYSFPVGSSAPGIFVDGNDALVPFPSGHRGTTYTLFITGDGVPSPPVATGAGPQDPNNLPKPQLPVRVTVGGVSATTTFVGIPTWSAGVTQINFTVPTSAPLGQQQVVVSVGNVHSEPATFTVSQ
jgi:uncharacterized protein (TIGR03437 family)